MADPGVRIAVGRPDAGIFPQLADARAGKDRGRQADGQTKREGPAERQSQECQSQIPSHALIDLSKVEK